LHFLSQKHKPPEIVHDFLFHMAENKRHRIWLHTLVEHLMRRDANKPIPSDASKDGFTVFHTLVTDHDSRAEICSQDMDGGMINMLNLYNKLIAKSSWGGAIDLPREGKMSFQDNLWMICKPGYSLPLLKFLQTASKSPRSDWAEMSMWGDKQAAKACWDKTADLAKQQSTYRCLQKNEEAVRQPFEHDMTPFVYLMRHTDQGQMDEKLSWAQDVPSLPDFRTFDLDTGTTLHYTLHAFAPSPHS
jgi:hypothetical protein